ncbi:hypothetical protein V2J09_008019 [Rumex salicifolius]
MFYLFFPPQNLCLLLHLSTTISGFQVFSSPPSKQRLNKFLFQYIYLSSLHSTPLHSISMSFEDFTPIAFFFYKHKLNMLTASQSHGMFNSTCLLTESSACRDDTSALNLKLIAMTSILVAGVTGISVPLFGRRRGGGLLSHDGNLFVAAKAFAAGVILATGFVHMLPDGSFNLASPCLPRFPWSKFPFSGFIAMCSALLTLVADFVGTQVYERNQGKKKGEGGNEELDSVSGSGIMPAERVNGLHIVGVYAHADQHGHSHSKEAKISVDDEDGHGHSHSHSFGEGNGGARHAVVSQVLELGIVSHSVIIGLSLGVSNSPCTIRPLVAALSFHQFFEGFALGGCISEAQFKTLKTTLMSCFFALTTPTGIAVGIGLASFYNRDSPGALIVEGVLDSISAGILIYMSLVDLIAADFMSKKMRCNARLQIASYIALFLGATLMSGLAIWT